MEKLRSETNNLDQVKKNVVEMFPSYSLLPNEEQDALLEMLLNFEHQKDIISMQKRQIEDRKKAAHRNLEAAKNIFENLKTSP